MKLFLLETTSPTNKISGKSFVQQRKNLSQLKKKKKKTKEKKNKQKKTKKQNKTKQKQNKKKTKRISTLELSCCTFQRDRESEEEHKWMNFALENVCVHSTWVCQPVTYTFMDLGCRSSGVHRAACRIVLLGPIQSWHGSCVSNPTPASGPLIPTPDGLKLLIMHL